MTAAPISPDIHESHRDIIALQSAMMSDMRFRELCESSGLPWDFGSGYEPRWYNGPAPEDVRVLFFMAEPGAITPTESQNLLPAISYDDWIGRYDLNAQEHYWRDNLRELCRHIWPEDVEAAMRSHLAGSCTFWMSLAPGSQTSEVDRPVVNYFTRTYLKRFIALFPNAIFLAAGGKARNRLRPLQIPFEQCSALTRPESNKPRAHKSWAAAGARIRSMLAGDDAPSENVEDERAGDQGGARGPVTETPNRVQSRSPVKPKAGKREHGSASVGFGAERSNEETLGEAHALAEKHGDRDAASVIHQTIAACDPASGYRILLYRCTYGSHYSDSLKERRWRAEEADDLPERLHNLARKAIARKDEVADLHKTLIKDYKQLSESKRMEVAQVFRDRVRALIDG